MSGSAPALAFPTGIFADKETNLSLGMEAAEKALEMADISKEEIGVVICATITPDNIVPSQACMLQKEAGLPETVFAFDHLCSLHRIPLRSTHRPFSAVQHAEKEIRSGGGKRSVEPRYQFC